MNHKIWGPIVSCLTAAVLMAGLTIGVLPSTVNADSIEQSTDISAVDVVDIYSLAETLPLYNKTATIKIDQLQRYWEKTGKLAKTRTAEASTSSQVLVPTALEVSQVELDSIWHSPLEVDTYVTSPFGMRLHPVYGVYRMHYGVDLKSRTGDAVLAARGGTVVAVGYSSSAGNYVKIDHGDGFVTEYFHLYKYYVKVGQTVKGGECIALVGNTGASTGSHLHFGMMLNDTYVDPEDYINF